MRHRLRRVLLFGPTNPEIVKRPYIIWRLLKDRFEVRDRTFEMRLLHTNIAQRKISGGGARIQTIRMGPMIQQVQKACDVCGGNGVMYRQVKVQETLDVHVPKGATDGHKISFSEKADEIPDGEAGDVVFVLQEQPHAEYKRKGDDLFLERTISLSEALCGFKMELEALDGRKLIIKSAPGEVIKPVTYDPFREDGDAALWEMFEDTDCPSLDNAAVAETEDLNVCKKAVAKG